MAFDELHRHVARIALKAVGRKYEVALAGGNALMVHEVVSRHTEDAVMWAAGVSSQELSHGTSLGAWVMSHVGAVDRACYGQSTQQVSFSSVVVC